MKPLAYTFGRAGHSKTLLSKLVSIVVLFTLLVPSLAKAATPYRIDWRDEERADSRLLGFVPGDYFLVNQTPLYTPGSSSGIAQPDGSQLYELFTQFDSTLLGAGANRFDFGVTTLDGDNSYVDAHDVVYLTSGALNGPLPLFSLEHVGQAVTGTTTVNLSLNQINPPLAKDIAALTAAIANAQASLDANANKLPDLAHQEQLLQDLQSDLTALTNETLDQISREDLDAVLAKYTGILDANTRDALAQFVSDLKRSVADLQTQLSELVAQFGSLADSAASYATQDPPFPWDPSDNSNYTITTDASAVPDIPAPDLSQTAGAFDPNNDPYKAYADAIIARLNGLSVASDIPSSSRPQFISLVRGWRSNQSALQSALSLRVGVSQVETSAFLNAQNRVIGVIRQYMGYNDWFNHNPVDAETRSAIDGILAQKFKDLAGDIKDQINIWSDPVVNLDQGAFDQTISAIGRGAYDPDFDDWTRYDTRDQMFLALSEARAVARGALNLLPGPFVGVFIPLCEAVTGLDGCTSTSKNPLGFWDRIISGMGGVIGAYQFWHDLKGALNPEVFDDLAGAARSLEQLTLEERQILRTKVGAPTLATLGTLNSEAFVEFTKAGLGRSNRTIDVATVSTKTADALNAPFVASAGGMPAFIPKTRAITGVSAQAQYVRVYRKVPGNFTTGRFLTLKSEIVGLTPVQIADKLALKEVPTNIVDVAFPAGEPIAMGVAAGKVHGNSWGTGGGFQVYWDKANIDWTQYSKYFTNDRPIGLVLK